MTRDCTMMKLGCQWDEIWNWAGYCFCYDNWNTFYLQVVESRLLVDANFSCIVSRLRTPRLRTLNLEYRLKVRK